MLISGEKMLMPAELKRCVTWFVYFLDLLWMRYNCVKFFRCRICVTDFREGSLFVPPSYPWAAPKKLSLNRIKAKINKSLVDSLCRVCRKIDEIVDHIVSGCSKLAQKEYKRRHKTWEKQYIRSLPEIVILKLEINGMDMSQKVF